MPQGPLQACQIGHVGVSRVALGQPVRPGQAVLPEWVLLAGVGLGSWRLFRACKHNGEIPL